MRSVERDRGMTAGSLSLAILASLVACACMLVLPTPSPAATWKVQKLPFQPRYEGDPNLGHLLAVSCPSRSFCVAAGQNGRIAASENPTGGTSAWSTYLGPPRGDEEDRPPPPPGFPDLPPASPHINGVSCPSSGFCVAVSTSGDIYSSSNPMGGAATWSRTDIDGDKYETHLEGVSCPTVSFCVAVSGGAKSYNNPRTSGKILSSGSPAGGSPAWQVTQLDPTLDLRGVSCASPSLCVAVGRDGRMVVSTDPGGGPSAWLDAGRPGGPGHLQGIACLPGLCVAGNSGGNLLTNTDPAGAGWTERNGGGSVAITGISCPSASRCVAVDNNGDVLTSTDPTGGAAAWSFTNVLPYVPPLSAFDSPFNGMFGVSCPSPAFCAIAAADGTVLTSSDPFEASPGTATRGKRKRVRRRPKTILAHVDRAGRVKTDKRRFRVLFRFYATSKARGFVCKRDLRPYRRCSSPFRYWAGRGKHVFRVRAIGPTGLKGPVALDRFRIFSTDSKCPC